MEGALATLEIAGTMMRERATDESDMLREWVANGLGEELERVVWGEDGEMKIYDYEGAARTIQGFVRKFLLPENGGDAKRSKGVMSSRGILVLDTYLDKIEPHGLPRGGYHNPKGSFSISKKSNKVLSEGFIFQKGGDHRYAVGMDAKHYCPYYTILDCGTGGAYHCICQCETLKEGLIYT